MIDRDSRNTLAENLAALAEGTITNDQFLQSRPETGHDRAVDEIWRFGDSLYSDIAPYRLVGRNALSDDVRNVVQRCILFLQSDLEYEWPDFPYNIGDKWLVGGWMINMFMFPLLLFIEWIHMAIALYASGSLLWFICYIVANKVFNKYQQLFWKCGGDPAVWPFFRACDLERCKELVEGK